MGVFRVFVGFQWSMYVVQYVIAAVTPDVPVKVSTQLKRMKFIVSKVRHALIECT